MSYGVNAPTGLTPVATISGAPWTSGIQTFIIANPYATSLFTGDLVKPNNDGTIILGTTGAAALGVFQGCYYLDQSSVIQNIKRLYYPANTTANSVITADVITDPNTIYDIQVNGSTGNGYIAQTNIFNTFNISTAISGSTFTGLSGMTLDVSTNDNLITYNTKVIGLTPASDNNFGVQYNNALVIINNHFFRAGVAGV